MDPAELDRSLTELDEKIDRLRSLYEQYFMGLEKLEPQVPRKDVDRRIVVLRKEHIRNTALKFRFQTLIQRYNTMQQHWSRTLREIENGTYRRDLMKAAARFGVEEALTAVGKKRATKLLGALEKQREREANRKRALGGEPGEDLVVDVDMGEYDVDEEDDAPTPPPVRREAPRVHVIDAADAEGWDAEDGAAEEAPPAGPPPAKRNGLAQLFPKSIPAKKAEPSPSVPPQQRGGLRLGGGPSRRASPEALARLASLAGMDEPFDDAGAVVAEPPKPGRKPLLSSPLGFDIGSEPPPPPDAAPKPAEAKPAEPKPAPVKADVAAQKRDKPRLAPPPNAASSNAASSGAASPGAASASAAAQPRAARSEATTTPTPGSDPKGKRFGDLSDQRLREIYSEYVHVRRQRNESTAGITFDKLADSLRTQAERLGEKHGRKRVDYEVIVKDGKTLIKPIVK